MSWREVAGRDEPVRGNLAQFNAAVRDWNDAAQGAERLRCDFARIMAGTNDMRFSGEAADAFQSIVCEAQVALDDVPGVCADLAQVLRRHADTLACLRREADAALARARTHWSEQRRYKQQQSQDCARLASLRSQISYLQSLPPEQSAGQLATATAEFNSTAASERRNANSAASQAAQFNGQLVHWDQLHEQEGCLNKRTAECLNAIDLHGLTDPGFWERQFSSFANFVSDFAENLRQLGAALVSGDVEQILWRLRDVLDAVLAVLAIIGTIALAVVIIAGTGGTALVVIAAIGVGLALTKLRASSALMAMDSTDRKTGQKIGVNDLFFEAVDVGIQAASLVGAGHIARMSSTAYPIYNTRRAALDSIGVVLKKGYEISPRTVLGVQTKAARTALEKAVTSDDMRELSRGSGNGLWSGKPPRDPRTLLIERDLERLRAGNRGVSDPTQCQLVPAA